MRPEAAECGSCGQARQTVRERITGEDAINRYVTRAHELTPLITQISNDKQAAADGVRNVANGIPEANHHSWTAAPRATNAS
ncbi:hypothetical protein [Nocardia anaemiae]|uniref:hypothetical protein n=1 Tax=Nocardia anaemiae TaxID=263910 RepID=UPI0012F4F5D9|nr:hypothetical protein [Nocardia anaemiae]